MRRTITAIVLTAFLTTLLTSACSGDDTNLWPGACQVSSDDEDDGVIDSITTMTYNADGQLLTRERDLDNDGTADFSETMLYNAAGDLLTQETDADNDGVIDVQIINQYDANGQLTSFEQQVNQVVNHYITYTYHANGEMASSRDDEDGDGTWEWEYLYNEEGLLVQQGRDSDNDDVADKGRLYEYGPSGLLQIEELYQDSVFGEVPNSETTYLYDSAGYLTSAETFNFFQDRISSLDTHTWNADHTVLIVEYDRLADGTVEATEHMEYDLDGNWTYYAPDWDGDGTPDSIQSSTWDGENMLESLSDDDGDSTWESRSTYTYRDDGLLTESRRYSTPVDGEPDSVTRYEYDKAGNLLRTAKESGLTTSVTTYDYSCW